MSKKKKNDTDFEINFYEGILEKQPNFVEALSALGDVYTKIGECEKGLAIDKRLERIRPDDPYVLYNLACSYSLIEDVPSAFTAIKKAIENGYDDFNYLKRDSDLTNLKKDEGFIKFFSAVRKGNKSLLRDKDTIV